MKKLLLTGLATLGFALMGNEDKGALKKNASKSAAKAVGYGASTYFLLIGTSKLTFVRLDTKVQELTGRSVVSIVSDDNFFKNLHKDPVLRNKLTRFALIASGFSMAVIGTVGYCGLKAWGNVLDFILAVKDL